MGPIAASMLIQRSFGHQGTLLLGVQAPTSRLRISGSHSFNSQEGGQVIVSDSFSAIVVLAESYYMF